jgi:hypothetical protein
VLASLEAVRSGLWARRWEGGVELLPCSMDAETRGALRELLKIVVDMDSLPAVASAAAAGSMTCDLERLVDLVAGHLIVFARRVSMFAGAARLRKSRALERVVDGEGASFVSLLEEAGVSRESLISTWKSDEMRQYVQLLVSALQDTGTGPGKTAFDDLATVDYSLGEQRLTPLPRNYAEVITSIRQHPCPVTKQERQHPAICLGCGEWLCKGTECCRVGNLGNCNLHASTCGNGQMMFLLVRECSVFLVCENHSHVTHAPYLDEFGEPDDRLR